MIDLAEATSKSEEHLSPEKESNSSGELVPIPVDGGTLLVPRRVVEEQIARNKMNQIRQ